MEGWESTITQGIIPGKIILVLCLGKKIFMTSFVPQTPGVFEDNLGEIFKRLANFMRCKNGELLQRVLSILVGLDTWSGSTAPIISFSMPLLSN